MLIDTEFAKKLYVGLFSVCNCTFRLDALLKIIFDLILPPWYSESLELKLGFKVSKFRKIIIRYFWYFIVLVYWDLKVSL